jgi:hypothetical protein
MADHAFKDRPLNDTELELLRLALSSFKDGSGQQQLAGGSMPGYRDYERSLAAILGGTAPENKGIFDVSVPTGEGLPFGVSCKSAKFAPVKHMSSFMEMSNSGAKFRDHLLGLQINYATEPMLAGPALIELMTVWHEAEAAHFDLPSSKYAVLSHNTKWTEWQLLCFPLNVKMVNPIGDIEWLHEGKAVNGYINDDGRRHRLWQYYPTSGGQLKYYPLLSWAEWVTERFALEQPPIVSPLVKAQSYFGDIWPD